MGALLSSSQTQKSLLPDKALKRVMSWLSPEVAMYVFANSFGKMGLFSVESKKRVDLPQPGAPEMQTNTPHFLRICSDHARKFSSQAETSKLQSARM